MTPTPPVTSTTRIQSNTIPLARTTSVAMGSGLSISMAATVAISTNTRSNDRSGM